MTVTFSPTTVGDITGTLTVTFDSSLPDGTAQLSGIGDGACIETPVSEFPAPVDVTSEFASVAAGVSVTQLRANGSNFLTYTGISAYSTPVNQILYNQSANNHTAIVTAVPDGTAAQVITSIPTGRVHLSRDGRLAIFSSPGDVAGSLDIFGVFLDHADSHNKGNSCTVVRLTKLNMSLARQATPC